MFCFCSILIDSAFFAGLFELPQQEPAIQEPNITSEVSNGESAQNEDGDHDDDQDDDQDAAGSDQSVSGKLVPEDDLSDIKESTSNNPPINIDADVSDMALFFLQLHVPH